ncbi:ABC transporter substrate-binding protein [Actinoallomurus liliacearum]|uniref:ABC transporter substrate-binding protein n=1 Tax=Actinoallomurus liliacearum TaxID=1080073 RepID=A0ABP8TTD4_9ACTN
MSVPRIRLALRDWDHLVPLVTGRVRSRDFELEIESRAVTPDVLAEPELDGGETSFSRYALGRGGGDDRLVGLPVFVMRGFRHRCVLVRRDSELTSPKDLAEARIGLTGWPDSGNTWTRALLRSAGVDLGGIAWTVGPLVAGETGKDRVGPRPLPPNVEVAGDGESLVEGLADGRFDAIFTPFMPDELFGPGSRFRHLYDDHRGAELDYFRQTGFVPGIHLLAVKRTVVDRYLWLPSALEELFTESKRLWTERRRMLTDTAPWLLAELEASAEIFGPDWMPYGRAANAAMTAAFCEELHAQGIAPHPIDAEELFA